MGARHYIDSSAQNVAEALTALGGLTINGKLIMVGISGEPVEVPIVKFIVGRHSVQGWPCGTSADSQDTLSFSVHTGVRPMVEEFPLERAAEAYNRMISGKAQFRVVLKLS